MNNKLHDCNALVVFYKNGRELNYEIYYKMRRHSYFITIIFLQKLPEVHIQVCSQECWLFVRIEHNTRALRMLRKIQPILKNKIKLL